MANLRLPGPTPVPEDVFEAMHKQMIDHRGDEFAALLHRLSANLQRSFQTANDVFVLTSSGTGAMEAAVVNTLSPGQRVLAVTVGNFGDRFSKIASSYGADVNQLKFPDGEAADPEAIRQALKDDPALTAVLVTHNETSTGITNDLETIAGIVKGEFNKLLLVDAISSLGSIRLPVDSWDLDVVVAGSQSFVGAAYLAAMAAVRSGTGLITLAIPESIHNPVSAKATEPTYIPLPESSPGVFSPKAAELIINHLAGYDSLLVGCGMGQNLTTLEMLERVLCSGVALPPTVIDADALNFLGSSPHRRWWEKIPGRAIVTPHPGEMSLLSTLSVDTIESDRIGIAAESAAKWNKIVVLKGAHTVVASPTGNIALNSLPNPGLASAGTGDVLAGIIVGLVAQGIDMEVAATLGVYLHSRAGEFVRNDIGYTGMSASDVLEKIPLAIKALRIDS